MSKEILINDREMITSQTDAKGIITYVNDVFCEVAGYKRKELVGKNHNIIRHEDMPKAVFKLLWNNLREGNAIYAYVKNKAKNEDYYWVKAYVKPIKKDGVFSGAVSYRKPIDTFAKEVITDLYATLIDYEKTHSVDESYNFLLQYLQERDLSYNDFINRTSTQRRVSNPDTTKININQFNSDHILFKFNILDKVARGTKVEVVDSCCCAFGKELTRLSDYSFTSHPSWAKLVQEHKNVHAHMRQYVEKEAAGASKNELASILTIVDDDTKKIFKNLNEVVNQSK